MYIICIYVYIAYNYVSLAILLLSVGCQGGTCWAVRASIRDQQLKWPIQILGRDFFLGLLTLAIGQGF